jgi:transposase-like protein
MHIELFTMFYCPVCKSQEIFPVVGGYVGQVYLCKDCGYRGSFVLEIDEPGELSGKNEKNDKDRK